ncbi:MAG: hypothetical protein OXG78_03855 [Chloroflexi bacterium]|nr:hypothetical protein [Chloroflexota bacterium]
MEQRAELYDLRLHRLEQLSNSMVESQASMVQILQAQSVRLERIEKRLDRVEKRLDILEEQMAQVMTDVAFIRNYIETKGLD